MPEVSRFFGIIIALYFNEHNPPHFHAKYGDDEVEIIIDTLEIIEGSIPKRALALVLEWANEHRDELKNDWQLARNGKPLQKIEPLN
jgi:spore cortex formation protein SpoVR/YcgB (stage V sporulation)